MNPFSTEYLEQEIAFYDPKPYEEDGVKLFLKPIEGFARIDEFLNVAAWTEGPDIPILQFDGTIWMSLTWCEVQSHWVPLNTFEGKVLVGGLGMGYAALRLAARDAVEKVTVYEVDKRVIDFFKATQGDRPEMDKIEIIQGDVHDAEGEFDCAFIDIYPTLLPDELLGDAQFFRRDNPALKVSRWHFWGQELAYLTAIGAGYFDEASGVIKDFFDFWKETGKMRRARDIHDVDFCWDLVDLLEEA